ncbi:putative Ig domain-containing protein [Haloferula sp.]|uniref:putative Ig domain-containing protein n=1 Tax=Haloferula sp. TaxID=2497595 RepID=UPI003C748495
MISNRRVRFALKLVGALLLACSLAAPLQAQTKIMPLGDSNTRGKKGYNYRSFLRDRLINEAGYSMDYVGSGTSVGGAHGPGPDSNTPYTSAQITALGTDLEHEGWGGYTIGGIANRVNGWLDSRNPDTVLLMLGTNDFADGIGVGAIDRLDSLISQILTHKPGVTLVVGSIAPTSGGYAGLNRAVQEFNRDLPGIVNDYFGLGHNIYFADTGGGIDPSLDMVDGLHMTEGGYQKIGDGWFDVLGQLAVGNAQPQVTFTVNGPQTEGYFIADSDINFSALAFDSDGTIDRVAFYADGVLIGETTGEPHMLMWLAVPAGRYEITATAYDDLGFPGYSYPLTIQVGEPRPKAAIIIGNGALTLADQNIFDSIEALGFEPEFFVDSIAGSSGVGDAQFIVISSTVSSGKVGPAFRDSEVPVIVFEPFLFDDMSLTGGLEGLDFGLGVNQSDLVITAAAHPLAAGLSGAVTVVSDSEGFLSWGLPGGDVLSIGHLTGNPGQSAIFALEEDGLMVNGNPAANRRVGLFVGDKTSEHFTADGQALFDAAIVWATEGIDLGGGPGGGENKAPITGILGGDQVIEAAAPQAIQLDAYVVDDGRPIGNPVTVEWSSTSADVSFLPSDSPSTQVTITAYGDHPATVTVSDGEFSSSDTVILSLVDPNGPPAALTYSENPVVYELGSPITPNFPDSFGGDVVSYSVNPALPSGLSLDSGSGMISGTPVEVSSAADYEITATNVFGSTSVDLMIGVVVPPPDVLLVVGSLILNAGDSAILDWFNSRGSAVTLRSFADVQASDADGIDLVFITSTGSSSQLGGKLKDVSAPVIVCEPYVYDDMGLTMVGNDSFLGVSFNATQLDFLAPSHPLGTGLSGLTGVVTSGSGFFTWGIPGTAAVKVANLDSNEERVAIFGYDIGDQLANGQLAPHRRLGFFLGDVSASNLTGPGWQAFAAAIQWALEGGSFDPNGPPVQLTYSESPASYIQDEAITANFPFSLGGAPDNYSVTPNLPSGLTLNPSTGEISGTPTELVAPSVYQVTASNLAGSAVSDLLIGVDPPPLGRVLMVVGNTNLNSGDQALKAWFENQGYLVSLESFAGVQIADTAGKDLVFITSTGSSGALGGRLKNVPVPMIVCESFIFDDMGLTGLASGVDFGAANSESQINIISPEHPLAAGLAGLVDLVNDFSGFFTFGRAGASAIEVAALGSNPGRSAVFAYDTGVLLASGEVAVNRRLGLCFGDLTAGNLTLDGQQILSAAVQWAIEGGTFDPNGPPVQLNYSENPAVYDLDVAIPANSPLSFGGEVDSYSVLSALPAGLSLDPFTGVISGVPTAAVSQTSYTVTATNTSGSTSADVEITVLGSPIGDVLMVVGSTTLNPGDQALKTWFENQGYLVTLRSFAGVQASDADGMDVVFITSTGSSGALGGRLTDVSVPMIVCESYVFDDMGLTAIGNGVELGSSSFETQIDIVSEGHPLAAGLSGLSTIVSSGSGFFTWGRAGGEALEIATLGSNSGRSAIFAYDSGALLASGANAAHRRLGLCFGDLTAANLTAEGSQILAAAFQWALVGGTYDAGGAPVQLQYSQNPANYEQDVAITPNLPSSLGGAVVSYSILPALPAGLSFNTVSGEISGTPTESLASTIFQITATNAMGSTSTDVAISVSGVPIGDVLLVVGSTILNPGDAALRDWFEGQGFVVTLKSFSGVQLADAAGMDLVFITATGSSGDLGGRLSDASVPTIVCEPYIYDDMGLTAVGNNVQLGVSFGESQLEIVNPTHPIAAGLSGVVTVVSDGSGFFTWGLPGAGGTSIAALSSNGSQSAIFAYEAGSTLANSQVAPDRRVGLFMGDLSGANLTSDGLQLLSASVVWALEAAP